MRERVLRGERAPSYENKPVIAHEYLQWYADAFQELSRSRNVGMSACAIQISEMLAWLDLNGVDGTEDRKRFVRIIQEMDRVFLDWAREKDR